MLQNMSINQTFKIIGECCLMMYASYAFKAFFTVREWKNHLVSLKFLFIHVFIIIILYIYHNMDINFLTRRFWEIKKMNYCVLKDLMPFNTKFSE